MCHKYVYLIQDERLKQIAPKDAAFQFRAAAGIAFQEQGMSIKTTSLSGKNHDILVDEAFPQICRSKMRIFFGARNTNIPNILPSFVQRLMNWKYAGMMR